MQSLAVIEHMQEIDQDFVDATEQLRKIALGFLRETQDIHQVLDSKNQIEAVGIYLLSKVREREDKLRAQNNIAEIRLRYERQIGALLQDMKDRGMLRKGQNGREGSPGLLSLKEMSITKKQSARWQLMAQLPETEFDDLVNHAQVNAWELTAFDVQRRAEDWLGLNPNKKGKPHVTQATGFYEWYTPAAIIDLVYAAMGAIDLDPASCEVANGVVGATRFYTVKDDGLKQRWFGRVFLNPPYARVIIERFVDKLLTSQSVDEACVLTNNATETGWGQKLMTASDAICFLRSQINYWGPANENSDPLQGQMMCYRGPNPERFAAAFEKAGLVWIRQQKALSIPVIEQPNTTISLGYDTGTSPPPM